MAASSWKRGNAVVTLHSWTPVRTSSTANIRLRLFVPPWRAAQRITLYLPKKKWGLVTNFIIAPHYFFLGRGRNCTRMSHKCDDYFCHHRFYVAVSYIQQQHFRPFANHCRTYLCPLHPALKGFSRCFRLHITFSSRFRFSSLGYYRTQSFHQFRFSVHSRYLYYYEERWTILCCSSVFLFSILFSVSAFTSLICNSTHPLHDFRNYNFFS